MVAQEFSVEAAALSLWGKSAGIDAPRHHLLLQHLYDTLAVGELVWDEYLSAPTRRALDMASNGAGREFFAFVCGIHDVGKASPKFQSKEEDLASKVQAAGLRWRTLSPDRRAWHHTLAGAAIVRTECREAGWARKMIDWVWPLIGGHHGSVPGVHTVKPPFGKDDHGSSEEWRSVQRWLLEAIARAAGFEHLAAVSPRDIPTVGAQLTIAGAIIMADWLASDPSRFEPIDRAAVVSVSTARERARLAWKDFDLRHGIMSHQLPSDFMAVRFGREARPLQRAVEQIAFGMESPGLVIIEAPMGEGKTEAALVAAEVFAERWGMRGVFMGMPTQATSDPMFARLDGWRRQVAPEAPIMLLHGKRMFNKEYERSKEPLRYGPVYEDEDTFGDNGDLYRRAHYESASSHVVEWFEGRKRGLLAPISVGTIDNLLHAGTRTRHVMLRHAGLAQKVVILDEIHAASVYMSEFMAESLRWLGSCGVPVILLTATLPPSLRDQVIRAYTNGAGVETPAIRSPGYPAVIAVEVSDGRARTHAVATDPWRKPQPVAVRRLTSPTDDSIPAIVDTLSTLLRDGGTALVIRNTVDLAQRTYRAVAERFGDAAELLHARLTAAERATRTQCELELLGASDVGRRPTHILVATQVAEQSFDVDADVLISDLAPIDLLLQRAGRIHRHRRGPRPGLVAVPSVFVTGFEVFADGPQFPDASVMIYDRYPLVRAASLVLEAEGGRGWQIPTDIPLLVERAYREPASEDQTLWPEIEAMAWKEAQQKLQDRRLRARRFLLSASDEELPRTLGGLHFQGAPVSDDELLDVVVRDGEPSAEVVLVRSGPDGIGEYTFSGRELSDGGVLTGDDETIAEAVGSIVRLPAGRGAGNVRLSELVARLPVPAAWHGHKFLGYLRALVLDESMSGEVGGRRFRYDHRLGLVSEPR